MIVIINYNAGNMISVKNALDYLNIKNKISSDPKEILKADKIIIPGVGNALSAMNQMKKLGLDSVVLEAVFNNKPLMGICLGTQIIMSHSDEGNTNCLGIIKGNVKAFVPKAQNSRIPHMGWNNIKINKKHFVLSQIQGNEMFYFAHSYYVQPEDKKTVIGICNYIEEFPSIICQNNVIAFQFHPEKSGKPGLNILKQFNEWEL